jgi:hypothetical protein
MISAGHSGDTRTLISIRDMPKTPKPPATAPKSKTPSAPVSITLPDEPWEIVQVASFMRLTYQTARNHMLSGTFGPSQYDPTTRCLTVMASAVRKVQARAEKARAMARKKKRRRA